jgi:hypothetical protein
LGQFLTGGGKKLPGSFRLPKVFLIAGKPAKWEDAPCSKLVSWLCCLALPQQ